MAGSSCPPYVLGSHMESVETSAGSQDRDRGHVPTARQIPQTSQGVGTRHVGDRIAKPARGQTPIRFPAAVGDGQDHLSPLWSIFTGARSDPAAPGTLGGRTSGSGANVFRAAHSG